jgi:hypothetical protein
MDHFEVSGLIRVAGSTPDYRVLLNRTSVDQPYEVRGDLRPELSNLEGARIKAEGTLVGLMLVVRNYEVLEIAGHEPLVGILVVGDAGVALRTDDGKSVTLQDAPEELHAKAGAKVWVILDSAGVVTGYGVIRER